MADWPTLLQSPNDGVIHSGASAASCAYDARLLVSGGFGAGAIWPTANLAIYVPFWVETTVTAYQLAFQVTVQSGNYDIGLYDVLGNRLVSKGSTAVPVAGIAKADITDTLLTPGVYYMALCIDNITAAVSRSASAAALLLQVLGVQQQALGSVTLPNPATFANPGQAYLPGIAVALVSTI